MWVWNILATLRYMSQRSLNLFRRKQDRLRNK